MAQKRENSRNLACQEDPLHHCQMGLPLSLFSFGEGPSEAEDTLTTSLKRHISLLLLRINVLGRNREFERILLSRLSQPCEHKERDSPFFVSPFHQQSPIFRALAYTPAFLATRGWHSFQEFCRHGWNPTKLRAQCIILFWLSMDLEKVLFSECLQRSIVQ